MTKPNAKLYNDRLPLIISDAMKDFTSENCYLIKRRVNTTLIESAPLECHANVNAAVAKNGGEIINGWLLYKRRDLLDLSVYMWSFHSILQTAEGDLFDITYDQCYANNEYSTFWFDKSRKVDLTEGINYNNIVVIASTDSASKLGAANGINLNVGEPYWTTSNMKLTLPIKEHCGKYRWLTNNYPNNINRFESEFDIKIINGKLVGDTAAIHNKALLDYSLGSK